MTEKAGKAGEKLRGERAQQGVHAFVAPPLQVFGVKNPTTAPAFSLEFDSTAGGELSSRSSSTVLQVLILIALLF